MWPISKVDVTDATFLAEILIKNHLYIDPAHHRLDKCEEYGTPGRDGKYEVSLVDFLYSESAPKSPTGLGVSGNVEGDCKSNV